MEHTENEFLEKLIELEDLAQKKANIYGRLLLDVSLAKEMEGLAARHEDRKARLECLLYGKSKNKKANAKEGGMYEMKGGNENK